MVQEGERDKTRERRKATRERKRKLDASPDASNVRTNFINLRRAVMGKKRSGGGKRMNESARKELISKAVGTVARNRDVSRAEARRIVERRAMAGKSVGGYTRGAKKGSSERKGFTGTRRTSGPGR